MDNNQKFGRGSTKLQLRSKASILGLTFGMAMVSATIPSFAEDVQLLSKDGSSQATGEIVGIEGDNILLRTSIGIFSFEVDSFTCFGAACPVLDASINDDDDTDDDTDGDDDDDNVNDVLASGEFNLTIAASAGIADQLLPVLIEGLAVEEEANVVALDAAGQPLPEDIGRPLPGGPREDDDDDDDAEGDGDDEDEEVDVVTIEMRNSNGGVIKAFAVLVEEEEGAIEELSESEVDLVFLDEPAEDENIEDVLAGGGGNITDPGQERVIAVEGIVVSVSQDNPIKSLSINDVPRIFAGEITNWSQVGGADAPINVYSFDNSNAAFHYVEEMILEPADVELSDDANVIQTMRELTSKINADPNGFGVVPFTNQRGTKAVPIVSSCGVVAEASAFSIKNEEYLLNRRFYAYNRAEVNEETREFLDFLDTPEIDGLVEKAGFIDLSVIEQKQTAVAGRTQELIVSSNDAFELGIMRNLLVDMITSNRLSTTFRFALGSSFLDVRAQADIQRIADYIETQKPSEVLFVGFTDSIGAFEANARLSENRASSVLSAVSSKLSRETQGSVTMSRLGYGELSPVACNEEANGRRINRRVEVWVR